MNDERSAPSAVALEVHRGAPSAEELAAVVAVLSDAYAAEDAGALAPSRRRSSAWMRQVRAPRVVPRSGSVWGRFEG